MIEKKEINIACFSEGSHSIGLGHVVRTLAIARQFSKMGIQNILFFCNHEAKTLIEKKGFKTNSYDIQLSIEKKVKYLVESVKAQTFHLLIIDYKTNIPLNISNVLEKHFKLIANIDNGNDQRLLADINFYPPVEQVKKLNWNNYTGEVLSGWEYIILNDSLSSCKSEKYKNSNKIFISMGSSDPFNLTQLVIGWLNEIDLNAHFEIVIGKLFTESQKNEIKNLLKTSSIKYSLNENIDDLSCLMKNSDFAICAYSVTLYELACLGIPSIILSLSDIDYDNSKIFESEKMGISLGQFQRIKKKDFNSAIELMTNNYKVKTEMASNCKKNINAKGAKLIAEILLKKIRDINE